MSPDFLRRFLKQFGSEVQGRPETFCGAGEMKMIIGLGNPGTEYKGTRHNAGFEVVDILARRLEVEVKKKKFGALFGDCITKGIKLILLKPQRYMNRSGHVVATAAGFYKLALKDIIVITDDMALAPGRIRIRAKGSAGGHNGLADVIERLGSDEFARLRVGIGKSAEQIGKDYVLSRPAAKDAELIEKAIEQAQQAAVCWVENGIDAAMNRFNVRSENENQ